MNKLGVIKKRLIRAGVVGLLLVALALGVMLVADSFVEDAAKLQADTRAAVEKDEQQLKALQDKQGASREADKKYTEILLQHSNPVFLADREAIQQYLRDAKVRYRFINMKVTLAPEVVSKKPGLGDAQHDVFVREGVALEFDAISDVHVFSFLQDFVTQAPGLVRIQSLELQRKGDLTTQTLTQLGAGKTLGLVGAKVNVVWVSVQAKEAPAAAVNTENPEVPNAAAPAAPTTGEANE